MSAIEELCVRLIGERGQVPLSAEQWNALVERSETNTVFQTYEWFDAWWKTFGQRHRLFLLLVIRGQEVVALASFMLKRITLGIQQLEFVGTGNSDYQDIIAACEQKKEVVEAICAFLADTSMQWQRAWLCNIPSASSTLKYLHDVGGRSGLFFVKEARITCPALSIAGRQQEARRLIAKYSVRRPLNWFSKRGQVRFRHVTSLPEIEALLPTFFDQHIRRWAKVGKGSLFRDPRQKKFYVALARAVHGSGWLFFSTVDVDGELIAFHFGFDYGRVVTWYKPSFEPKYADRSPGMVLIQQLIADALSRDRKEIDFTVGNESFKERFANVHRSNTFVSAYRSRAVWWGALAIRQGRRLLGKLWRQIRP